MDVRIVVDTIDQAKYAPPAKSFSIEQGAYFTGYSRPTRVEGDIYALEVYGEVPKDISGTFYRVVAEPAFPPFFQDIWTNGDGMVSAFRINDGHVDFKQRYVQTEVLQACRKARQALLGKYRNRYTDRAEFKNRSVANVSVIPYKGKLLVTKEDSLAYAMDPQTLETLGDYDFDGQWESPTFTAHPKFDVETRELVAFGYEAKGDASVDNYYGFLDQHGRLQEKVWFKAPYCGFQHEMAFTKNWVIFPLVPVKCDLERLKNGGEHWAWSNKESHYFGVLPRYGASGKDVKWFKGPNHYTAHVANAWEDEDGKIVMYITQADENMFFWSEDGEEVAPLGSRPFRLAKYTFDPKSTDLTIPKYETVIERQVELHRIDDRFMGRKSRYVYGVIAEGGLDWEFLGPRWGGGYAPMNGLYKFDLEKDKLEVYSAGPRAFTQEPIFVPRTPEAPEGDGYMLALVNDYEEMVGKLVIIDTNRMSEPMAIVRLPLPLRPGVHGAWVDDTDVDMRPVIPPVQKE